MLLWASKFATAKIECSFEMGKQTPLGGITYFAVNGTNTCCEGNVVLSTFASEFDTR